MRAEDIRRVLVIGSGTMGLQIGLQAAIHGCSVVLHDTEPAALDAAHQRLRGYGEAPVAAGLIAYAGVAVGLGRRRDALRRSRRPFTPGGRAAR